MKFVFFPFLTQNIYTTEFLLQIIPANGSTGNRLAAGQATSWAVAVDS
jgi:hypothetical protein